MIITIVSKFVGFGRDIVLSYYYGATSITDAYLVSLTIPSVIFSFIGTAITTGYIPMFSKIESLEGTERGNRFNNNLINMLLLFCTALVVLGTVFSGPLVHLFASGFEGEVFHLATRFTRIGLLAIYFTGILSIFTGFLQIKGNFAIPALIGFPLNVIMILSIIISAKSNVTILALGVVLASLSQVLLVLPFAYKNGYRYCWTIDFKDEHIRTMVYLALPLIIGVSVNHVNVLVDKTLASRIAEGGISALNYAYRLNGFLETVFVASITTALYPAMSKMVVEDNIDGLKKSVSEAISTINLLVIPATVGALLFAKPIVNLLFGRGMFDEKALALTSSAFLYYSVGMIGYGLRLVLMRVFYAMQDTKTPAINAAIGVGLNIVLNIILSKYMGIGGLALATSISAIIVVIMLFVNLRKKIGAMGIKTMSLSFIKIVVASLVMGIVARLGYFAFGLKLSPNLSLILSIALGAGFYFILIYFSEIPEVDALISSVKRRILPQNKNN